MERVPLPSEIREYILGEHRNLRKILAELGTVADSVLGGTPSASIELRRQVVALEAFFCSHLDLEEALLMPVIQSTDAWGPQRSAAMREEHARQRAIVERAADQATSAAISGPELAAEMRALVAAILEDMKEEERAMLHRDFLQDEVVTIDQSDG